MTRRPFTFGVALTPRATAGDWGLVQRLLALTLETVRAQSDPDWRVVVAGHDRPADLDVDRRIEWLGVDWPVEPPGPHNEDSGRKKHLINDQLLAEGGGLLMLLDADDWADRRVVETARRAIGEGQVGGLIENGLAVDLRTLKAAPLPGEGVFGGGFHELCGSSTVAWLRPELDEPVRRDPFSVLRSHHQWRSMAAAHGAALASLPVSGGYLINTSENHSDVHGPHAAWRRGFQAAVNARGRRLDTCDGVGVRTDAAAGAGGLHKPDNSTRARLGSRPRVPKTATAISPRPPPSPAPSRASFTREVVAPYPRESEASGVGEIGGHAVVWRRRKIVAK
jgi:hypothetical protein